MKDQFDILKWRRSHLISENLENTPEMGDMGQANDIESTIAEFKTKFRGVSIFPEKMSPSKIGCDIKARIDFSWGDWEGVKQEEEAITNFFKEKGYKLVDEFEYDDDDRRATLSLYYKKM